ncbi:MAG: hypothetical protein ACFFD3_02915 [Candidatus Thorarchaeota archaeon]
MRFGDEYLDISGRKVKFARIISRLLPAPLFNFYLGIILAFYSPVGLGPYLNSWTSLAICIVFMVILPVSPIILEAKRGNVDLDVSEQAKRNRFFLAAIAFYVAAFDIYYVAACDVMAVFAAAYATVTTGIMIATRWSKVSVHAAGVGGPGTALLFIYGAMGLLVVAIWFLVIWARIILRQHSLQQSLLGLGLAILITIATYAALW